MVQRLCTTVVDDLSSGDREDLTEAIDSLVSQMNSHPDISHSFTHYQPSYQTEKDPGNYDNESEYIRDTLAELAGEGYTEDGDAWIIADGYDDHNGFGYGAAGEEYWTKKYENGVWMRDEKYTGGRVLHTPSQWVIPDPVTVFKCLAIHEMCHNLGAEHNDGTYEIEWDGSTARGKNISPMATAYTYVDEDEGDRFDTCWAGTGRKPDDFCETKPNDYVDEWIDEGSGCNTDRGRHTLQITDCTAEDIDRESPL